MLLTHNPALDPARRNEYTDNTGNTDNTKGSKADRIERTYENGMKSVGHTLNPTGEAQTEALLKRAINNEFAFEADNNGGVYFHVVSKQNPQPFVLSFTPEVVVEEIANLDSDAYTAEYWEFFLGNNPR